MNLSLRQIDSTEQLRELAGVWDDLWYRSDVTLPTLRAEPLTQWLEHFASAARFRCLCVWHDERLMAALPLVETRVARLFAAGGLPSNEWASSGELLLDAQADAPSVLDVLVAGLRELPWQVFWLDEMVTHAHRTDSLLAALGRQSMAFDVHPRYHVGKIDHQPGWEDYSGTLSKNHRRKMRKCRNRLEDKGPVRLATHAPVASQDVERLLERAFEVEDRSWKGRSGTSVLRSDDTFTFLVRQASCLAELGDIRVSFLECDQRPIAFAYGWTAKGVYHSFKIGYDDEFAAYSPGHLLRYELLRQFHDSADIHSFDCLGELNAASAKWTNDHYTVARIVIATRQLQGRMFMLGYQHVRPWLRSVAESFKTTPSRASVAPTLNGSANIRTPPRR